MTGKRPAEPVTRDLAFGVDTRRWARVLGANVRVTRVSRGLTLAQLAARMRALGHPMSINKLSALERRSPIRGNRGTSSVTMHLDLAIAFAEALGCDLTELLRTEL